MKKIIFIAGGARSGKSSFAEKLARKIGKRLVYLATAEAKDTEMRERIKKHRKNRNGLWKTIEEPIKISGMVKKIPKNTEVVLLDCITLWVSNCLLKGWNGKRISAEIKRFMKSLDNENWEVIIVSNDVGGGIVPESATGRKYRDELGIVNQQIAKKADIVYQMFYGIPVVIKS